MKYNWFYKNGEALNKEDKEYFEKMNKGYKATGETLEERYEEVNGREGGGTTYAVMKAKTTSKQWTPYGMCRDCGDHYIIAKWSRYDRIDKETFVVTIDVADR